jgi:hypothetical protein
MGQPIPDDLKAICRICRTTSKKEQIAIQKVLVAHFTLENGNWHHARADREIDEANKAIESQRESGKIAALKRWAKEKESTGSTYGSTDGLTNGSTGRSAIQPPTYNLKPKTSERPVDNFSGEMPKPDWRTSRANAMGIHPKPGESAEAYAARLEHGEVTPQTPQSAISSQAKAQQAIAEATQARMGASPPPPEVMALLNPNRSPEGPQIEPEDEIPF